MTCTQQRIDASFISSLNEWKRILVVAANFRLKNAAKTRRQERRKQMRVKRQNKRIVENSNGIRSVIFFSHRRRMEAGYSTYWEWSNMLRSLALAFYNHNREDGEGTIWHISKVQISLLFVKMAPSTHGELNRLEINAVSSWGAAAIIRLCRAGEEQASHEEFRPFKRRVFSCLSQIRALWIATGR